MKTIILICLLFILFFILIGLFLLYKFYKTIRLHNKLLRENIDRAIAEEDIMRLRQYLEEEV